jgi:hypothetical protein
MAHTQLLVNIQPYTFKAFPGTHRRDGALYRESKEQMEQAPTKIMK